MGWCGQSVLLCGGSGPISAAGVRKMLAQVGVAVGFGFGIHTRALPEPEHKNIEHTASNTQLSANWFD